MPIEDLTTSIGIICSREELSDGYALIEESVRTLSGVDHLYDEPTIRGWLRNAAHALLKASTVLGAYGMTNMRGIAALGGLDSELTVLYVHPDAKGLYLHVGSKLLRHAEGVCSASGNTTLQLESSFLARGFYRKHGYEQAGLPCPGAGVSWNFPMIKYLDRSKEQEKK